MNFTKIDQLGEPTKTEERAVWCRTCREDTWHQITFWRYGTAIKDCTDCGEISDYEVAA